MGKRQLFKFPEKVSQLKEALFQLHAELGSHKQKEMDVRDVYLDHIKDYLISTKILKSRDQTVKELGACCLADILHIYAPELPYERSEDIELVFEFFISQLRGLEKDSASLSYKHAFYILEKLSACKSSCILIDLEDMSDTEVTSSDQMLIELFDALLDIITPNHSHTVESFIIEMISSVIEEHDSISPNLLDCLLSRLLAKKRKENKRAYDITCKVIKRCCDHLCESISNVVNNVIVGTNDALKGMDEIQASKVEIKEFIYDVIFELHIIEPTLLLYILPNIQKLLLVDDVTTRTNAVQVFSNIFINSSVSYIKENDKIFHNFLRRLQDNDASIRKKMILFAGTMVSDTTNPEIADFASETFIKSSWDSYEMLSKKTVASTHSVDDSFFQIALMDKDFHIRKEILLILNDLLKRPSALQLVNVSLLKSVAKRMDDKRADIATEAVELLANLFATHISSLWSDTLIRDENQNATSDNEIESDEENTSKFQYVYASRFNPCTKKWETTKEEMLHWIPEELLRHSNQQRQQNDVLRLKHVRTRMVDSVLLSKKLNSLRRSCLISEVWFSLSDVGKASMKSLLIEQRSHAQLLMQQFLHQKSTDRLSDQSSSTSRRDKALDIARRISSEFIPNVEGINSENVFDSLFNHRDQTIFRDLQKLADASATHESVRSNLDDLVSRIGSKTEQGKALRILAHRMCMSTVDTIDLSNMINQLKYLHQYELAHNAGYVNVSTETENKKKDKSKSAETKYQFKTLSLCQLITENISKLPKSSNNIKIIQSVPWLLEMVLSCCNSIDKRIQSIQNDDSSVSSLEEDGDNMEVIQYLNQAALHLIELCFTIISNSNSYFKQNLQSFKPVISSCVKLLSQVCTSSHIFQPQICKFAMKTLVSLTSLPSKDKGKGLFNKLLKSISKAYIDVKDKRLECVTIMLSVLVKQRKDLFEDILNESTLNSIVKFTFNIVKQPYTSISSKSRSLHSDLIMDTLSSGSNQISTREVRLKLCGIKLLCSEIMRRITSFEQESDFVDEKGGEDYIETKQLLMILRQIVAEKGNPWASQKNSLTGKKHKSSNKRKMTKNDRFSDSDSESDEEEEQIKRTETSLDPMWPPSNDQKYQSIRLAAASSILAVISHCSLTRKSFVLVEGNTDKQRLCNNAKRWIQLSHIALDPDEAVREELCQKLYKYLLSKGVCYMQYGSFLVLASSLAPSNTTPPSLSRLRQLIKLMYRQAETVKIQSVMSNANYLFFTPECLLPNLIYLLSYHPLMPQTSTARAQAFLANSQQKLLTKPLILLIDQLTSISKMNGTYNTGYMFAICNNIIKDHVDILNPNDHNIHMISEMTCLLMNRRLKCGSKDLNFPGDVPLPPVYTSGVRMFADDSSSKKQRLSVSTPTKTPVKSYLPMNFQFHGNLADMSRKQKQQIKLALKPASAVKAAKQSASKKKKRTAKKKAPKPAVSPERVQPRRKSSRGKSVSYVEVDSDIDMSEAESTSSEEEFAPAAVRARDAGSEARAKAKAKMTVYEEEDEEEMTEAPTRCKRILAEHHQVDEDDHENQDANVEPAADSGKRKAASVAKKAHPRTSKRSKRVAQAKSAA